jgi:Integrase zinc binding domain
LRNSLLFLCHDDADHLTGSSRMIYALIQQCRVHWRGLHADVAHYIASCFRCQFAKAAKHKPSLTGTVNPTMAPRPHHTWYLDLKGAMPKETGYILVIVEAVSRYVLLRKCNDATSTEVCLERVIFY